MNDWQRKRLNDEQRKGFMGLMLVGDAFEVACQRLGTRLEDYRFTKRDLGMVRSAVKRLTEEALNGLDHETRRRLAMQVTDFEPTVQRKSPIRQTQYIVMPHEDEWQLIQNTLELNCKTCLKDGAECEACKTRKLLSHYVTMPEQGFGCEFSGADLAVHLDTMSAPEGVDKAHFVRRGKDDA